MKHIEIVSFLGRISGLGIACGAVFDPIFLCVLMEELVYIVSSPSRAARLLADVAIGAGLVAVDVDCDESGLEWGDYLQDFFSHDPTAFCFFGDLSVYQRKKILDAIT